MMQMTKEQRRVLRDLWHNMIKRCHAPDAIGYKNYGGRGIYVCDRWRESFDAFAEDMGPRPAGRTASGRALYSIDRVNNDGPYSPENCRWATPAEQLRNRTVTRWIEFDGRRMVATDWARELGISTALLHWRLKRLPLAEALSPEKRPNRRGEHHPMSKLTSAQVAEIRASNENNSQIARRLGVSNQLVSRIRLGQHRVEEAA